MSDQKTGHDDCGCHAAVCPGVIYCLKSEILFIRADQVKEHDAGEQADPFAVVASVARPIVTNCRHVRISGVMMVAKHIPLPLPTPGLVHAMDLIWRFRDKTTANGVK